MMRSLLTNSLVALAGMVSVPAIITSVDLAQPAAPSEDPRLARLEEFFQEHGAPAWAVAHVFLSEADRHDLDWRLLPSLSFVESTGGKMARNNNLFGWDCGRAQFPSPSASIRAVAFHLAHSRRYKNKGLDELLETYNPDPGYPEKVKSVMRRIAPSEMLAE